MQKLLQLGIGIARSPHTSVPGAIILICAIGEIWLPAYAAQFSKTRQFAMSYGFLMASQVAVKSEGKQNNTSPESEVQEQNNTREANTLACPKS